MGSDIAVGYEYEVWHMPESPERNNLSEEDNKNYE